MAQDASHPTLLERFPNAHAVLLVLPIALLPVGRTSELPLALLAVLGARRLWTSRGAILREPAARTFTVLFLAIWLPMVASLPDSVFLEKSLQVTAGYPRFYLAGLYAAHIAARPEVRATAWRILIWVVGFWLVDSAVQLVFGSDLFGQPYTSRLGGVFGDDLKQGQVLAVLGPILLFAGRRALRPWLHGAFLAGLLAAILLSGTRASWIMVAVAGAGMLVYAGARHPRHRLRLLAAAVLVPGLLLPALYVGSDGFRDRLDRSLLIFAGDRASFDAAVSHRLSIWQHAYEAATDHPINGIGARAYRKVYYDYAKEGDIFTSRNMTVTHPHQLVLEVAVGAGVTGLAGLGMFYFWLIRSWRGRRREATDQAIGPALAVLALVFPVNTHLALYSSFWGGVFWWCIAVYVAAVAFAVVSDRAPASGDAPPPPFGTFALPRWAAALAWACHRLPSGWLGRRAAFFLRRPVLGLRRERVDIEVDGVRFRLHPGVNLSDKRLLTTPDLLDGAERRFLARVLPEGAWLIDIGANIGGYSLLLAGARPDIGVLAVEPDPELAVRLRDNVDLNRLGGRVVVEQAAVTERSGRVVLYRDPVNRGRNSLLADRADASAGAIEVDGVPLCALLSRHSIDRADAFKLDIEGHEHAVLARYFGEASADRWPPYIQLEQHRKQALNEAVRLVIARGYRVVLRTRMNVILIRAEAAGDGSRSEGRGTAAVPRVTGCRRPRPRCRRSRASGG